MDPITPQEPKPETPGVVIPAAPQSGAGHVDLGKILLPKKETPGHSVDSAQRINAGALLEQEITASTLGTDTRQEQVAEKAAEVQAAAATPAPVVEESVVKPLETFQRDIESVVQHDNVSVLSIATAEAERQSQSGSETPEVKKEKTRSFLFNSIMIGAGLLFLVGASGALAYLVTRTSPVSIATVNSSATPIIAADAVKEITITPGESRANIMASLNAAKQATSLSLGLMSQLLVTESSTTASGSAVNILSTQDFLTTIAPSIPPSLARAFKPEYLLGVHVYDGNQPFIVANVYSYEDAYAGMLSWEPYIAQDLSPLFTTGSAPAQATFVDTIIENHDTRALLDTSGKPYLLWTFLDRNTLVITTNDATLREIISRLKSAPITPIPSAQ